MKLVTALGQLRGSASRRAVVLACALAAGLAASPALGAAPEHFPGIGVSAVRAADILRAYPLRTVDGGVVSVPVLAGQIVVLSFWATWCRPCQREMPRLEKLRQRLAAQGASVVAISVDEDSGNVDHFVRRHALHLPIVHDGPNGLARQLDLRQIPLTLVLDRTGHVAFTSSSTDPAGMDALAAATDDLIAGRAVAATVQGGNRR